MESVAESAMESTVERVGQRAARRAVFVVGQKGGVGKTTLCRGLLQLYRDAGLRTAAYDADGAVGQLLQYYGQRGEDGRLLPEQDPYAGVGYFDVRETRQRDWLIAPAESDAQVVLMDLPGGSIGEMGKVLGDAQAPFAVYRERGFEVIVVVVISVVKASVRAVLEAVDLFGESARYVVVKNLSACAGARAEDFRVYDGYQAESGPQWGAARRAIEERKGQTICMPVLLADTYSVLDEHDYGFGQAREMAEIGHRERVKMWLRALRSELTGGILEP